MYIFGQIITPKQLSSAAILILGLVILTWTGYDALSGKITVCSRYGAGCSTREYAGAGDYGYWIILGLYLCMATFIIWFGWCGLRNRVHDSYGSGSNGL